MKPLQIFVGYDSKEPLAYHVCCHSILRHASVPVSITPLVQSSLRSAGLYTRERGPLEATEFSMTRFLVPKLVNYEGMALFMDCDMLMQEDVAVLFDQCASSPQAVHVCQHDYTPSSEVKFLNQTQTVYPRKNWSSFMLFNASACRKLSPGYVNMASGLDLHRMNWLDGDNEIGSLPLDWNWLVGEYVDNPMARNLHYTLGGPWFPATQDCPQADLWLREKALAGA